MKHPLIFVNETMVKKLPPRPIAGGTNNGARLRRFAYWRTGYGANLPDRLDFYLVQAGEFHCRPNYRTGDFEFAGHTQVFYHLEGEAILEYSKRRRPLDPGDLFISPPGHAFTYESERGARYHWFVIGGEWPRALGEPAPKYFSLGLDRKIEAAFVDLREILLLRKPGYPFQAVGVFYELLARLETLSQSSAWPESAYPEAVRNAMIFLRENAYGPFSAVETARAVDVSPSYLRALFEKWLGESPRRFHMRCRVDLAKRLLSEQRLSVFEVAAHIGFADAHHFSRVFKKITGLAPTHYTRQQNQD